MVRISDVTSALEQWAPNATQQSYDNVGLQVGDDSTDLSCAIIALDLTPAVIEEAIEKKAQLIITHHPLIFRPQKSITMRDWNGSLILKLAQAGIALYCIHTNLDAAKDGVSFALAKQLGLKNIRFLRPLQDTLVKLVTFVPEDHFDAVRAAMADAGAGKIGEYDDCAFTSEGTGYFRPGTSTNPHIGKADGSLTSTKEIRIEAQVQKWQLGSVLHALHKAHPYEEIAYDVYPLQQNDTQVGMGAVGEFEEPLSLAAFLSKTSKALSANGLRYAGDEHAFIKRVAVCGGSGSDLLHDALRAGADAYLTADVTYHRFFEALDTNGHPRIAYVDAIHYETEACTEDLLKGWLEERFDRVKWIKTTHKTNPIKTFIHD